MHLRHLHIAYLIPYTRASQIQNNIVRSHLNHRALPPPLRSTTTPPPPTLLTFSTPPTYTIGRREIKSITPDQIEYLKANGTAEFHPALRGGQTTFHGPGQLVAYLILTLATHGLGVRSYVELLESCLIDTCAQYGIKGFTDPENPGVWVTEDDKIASVGIHLRRGVASHGVGLNVNTDLKWFERIVACGLVGKKTTNFRQQGAPGKSVGDVARAFAAIVAKGLQGVDTVSEIMEGDVLVQ